MSILYGPIRPELICDDFLADIFESTAIRCPQKIALIFENEKITYGELNQRAELLALKLIGIHGAKPGEVICLFLPRGIDLLVAQIAIGKTGSAWLPMDYDCAPITRVLECMRDSNAIGCISDKSFKELSNETNDINWIVYNELFADTNITTGASSKEFRQNQQNLSSHPAYLIYTSGSTGKPKGIVINQHPICHFLRSENAILQISEHDIVAQQFSVAFDMSFEEIWISYLVGATLWIVPKQISRDPEALCEGLTINHITVLHVVPTLLALFPKDVPSLRLINLGGEMCPESLIDRFLQSSSTSRRMFNTYGPSETTVSATLESLLLKSPITIGLPLPNYNVCIVEANGNSIVPLGETGELCIFGIGLAQGYKGRDDLTELKFVTTIIGLDNIRVYRTGDLAKIHDNKLYCLGRTDDQVKIRGFRVELGEIEAILCQQSNIGTAAVLMIKMDGLDQLIAYITRSSNDDDKSATCSSRNLRKSLSKILPIYMVPNRFVDLKEMPRLTSGKIDRHALRALNIKEFEMVDDEDPALVESTLDDQDECTKTLFTILNQLFPNQRIQIEDDLFDDLGAHSLFVSQLVSNLRMNPLFAEISVQSIYQSRKVGSIKRILQDLALDHRQQHHQEDSFSKSSSSPTPIGASMTATWLFFFRRLICGLAQLISAPFILFIRVSLWLLPYYAFRTTGDDFVAALYAIFTFIATQLVSFGISILFNRILLCNVRPGIYPLYGFFYFRFWLSERFMEAVPLRLFHGSPLFVWYYRALGSEIGSQCHLSNVRFRIPQLVKLGNTVSIGSQVLLENATIQSGGFLVVGSITLGNHVVVGSASVIGPDVKMDDYSQLGPLSTLQAGSMIPSKAVFDGSPGQFIQYRNYSSEQVAPEVNNCTKFMELIFYSFSSMAVAVLFFLIVFPSIVVVDSILKGIHQEKTSWNIRVLMEFFALALPAAIALILLAWLLTKFIRTVLIRPIQPGTYSLSSSTYYRKWFLWQIQVHALDLMFGIFATVYSQFWFRAIGVKVGNRIELSNGSCSTPELVEFGDESFAADLVFIGDDDVRSGCITLKPVKVGRRTFLGNGSYIPDGTILPNDVLIGVLSRAPANDELKPGQTWIGSPPILIPKRNTDGCKFPEHLTFYPTRIRYFTRAAVELVRIIVPLAVIVAAAYNIIFLIIPLKHPLEIVAAFLALATLFGFICFVIVFVLKWILIGQYKPGQYPMWTLHVWLSEMVTSLYNEMAVNNFLGVFKGTPFLSFWLWLLGCKIGKNVFMDTTDVTEFDCVKIEDNSILNTSVVPQTHLFEDRVMKIGKVHIGKDCSIAARSLILYDAIVGDGVRLGSLTLIMKGEQVPQYSSWIGTPARPWNNNNSDSSFCFKNNNNIINQPHQVGEC